MKLLVLLILVTTSVFAFDHSHKHLSEILNEYVTFKGKQSLVNYAGLKRNLAKFNVYLETLSKISKKEFNVFSKDEQLAFLINAYNAFTLKLIINHYPINSIKDTGSFFTNPWKKKFFKFLGEETYLDKIEHEMIRKDFNEPRIHFAVNCASIGCPSLQKEAYTSKNLERLLEKGAVHFILNTSKNYVKKETLYLSQIFKWYGDDFKVLGGYEKYVLSIFGLKGKYKVEFLDYDWSLNDVNDSQFYAKIESLVSKDIPSIGIGEAVKRSDLIFLDAREALEFEVSHIKDAQYVGFNTFDLKNTVKKLDKTKTYIVYCSVGYRSSLITKKLNSEGFKAYNLYGGIFEWINKGKPVYNELNTKTDKVHAYNKEWSQWLKLGTPVF